MKVKNIPGEFAFYALIKGTGLNGYMSTMWDGWRVSECMFFTPDEIQVLRDKLHTEIKWPVEVYEDGSVRVISQEEIDEDLSEN